MNKSIDPEYYKTWYQTNLVRERTKRREYHTNFRETNTIQAILNGRKNQAKNKGIEFSITIDDLPIPDVCPILKTPFVRKTQYAMSIDRKDPTKGYVPGNVWVISRKANVMKNNATPEELKLFAEWVNNHD